MIHKQDMKLLFKDIKKKIESKFTDNGWVLVFSLGYSFEDIQNAWIYSSLVSPSKTQNALKNYSWEISFENDRPGFTSFFEKNEETTEYFRFSRIGYEPLIYYRKELGRRDNYLELSEEFRLYHNLYEDFISHEKKVYIYTDNNGDEEIAARIDKTEAYIKLKYLKDYISARNVHFLIYFDFMRFSKKTVDELEIREFEKDYSTETCFYNHRLVDIRKRHIREDNTQSWLMGKTLIEKIKDYKPNIWGTIEERDKYVDFIIDYNDNGDNRYFTCDENKLGNYFGGNSDSPLYVTPVYFKKDVLKKYYDNPQKYSVSDGHISCYSRWGLRLDNSCKDYVIVLLGDLGKLQYKEQLYWKSYNIPPQEDGFSLTAYKRFFEGEPFDPQSPDLYLKMKFLQFDEAWRKKYGWSLFKPLSKEDFHHFKSLHVLTSEDNDKEFDEQVLSLTKIFIDSLNEKELTKDVDIKKDNAKGIDKLEAFLEHKGLKLPEIIEFFRKVQALRSSTVAHRRNIKRPDTRKILEYFNFDNLTLEEILNNIFENFIKTIKKLKVFLLKDA